MLSKLISKEQCASCRFCCSYLRTSTWEAPLFTEIQYRVLCKKYTHFKGKACKKSYTLDFDKAYKTDDPTEEAACPFLDRKIGCILSKEEKPFDCKIWPLRIMCKNNKLVLALTPTCPAMNLYSLEELKQTIGEENLYKRIYEYAQEHPDIIKDYREGFPILKHY